MMMYFEFNEHKLKQNNFTKEQCFRVIDKVMNEYGVYANQPGTYMASDESGFSGSIFMDWVAPPPWNIQ